MHAGFQHQDEDFVRVIMRLSSSITFGVAQHTLGRTLHQPLELESSISKSTHCPVLISLCVSVWGCCCLAGFILYSHYLRAVHVCFFMLGSCNQSNAPPSVLRDRDKTQNEGNSLWEWHNVWQNGVICILILQYSYCIITLFSLKG